MTKKIKFKKFKGITLEKGTYYRSGLFRIIIKDKRDCNVIYRENKLSKEWVRYLYFDNGELKYVEYSNGTSADTEMKNINYENATSKNNKAVVYTTKIFKNKILYKIHYCVRDLYGKILYVEENFLDTNTVKQVYQNEDATYIQKALQRLEERALSE